MPKTDLVCCLFRKQILRLSQLEKLLFEIKFFTRIYYELSEFFSSKYKEYQRLIKSDSYQEESMCNVKLMQEMIKDILSTGDYSLVGISTHTRIPEDVLTDLAAGLNNNPTFELSRKLFELHIEVRHELYDKIMHKVALEYLVRPTV